MNRLRTSLTLRVFFLTFIGFFSSSLLGALGPVIDGLIIGHTMDSADMSAISITAPVWLGTMLFSSFLAKGNQIICSGKLSKGKVDEARDIYSMSLITGAVITVIFMVCIIALRVQIINLLGIHDDHPAFDSSIEYLVSGVLAIPASTLLMQVSNILYLEGERRFPIYSVIALSVSDILMDFVGVSILDGGMFAMGLATTISYYIALTVVLLYYKFKTPMLVPRFTRVSPKIIMEMAAKGSPLAVSRMTSAWKTAFINRTLGAVTTAIGLAAFNVQVQLGYITNAIIFGLAQTMSLMCSIYYEEQNRKALRTTALIAFFTDLIVCIGITLMFSFKEPVIATIKLYAGDNEDAYVIIGVMLVLYGRALIGQSIAVHLANYLQATRHTIMSNIVYVLDDVILVYYVINLIGESQDIRTGGDLIIVAATFLGLVMAQILMCLLIPLIIIITNHRWVFGWDAVLMLPKGFGVTKDRELMRSPVTMEDAVSFSADAYDLCIRNGVPTREAYAISLAAEEFITNSIEYGETDSRQYVIEARLMVKTDEAILSIRDNCAKFDPREYYKSVYNDEDKTRNIGIRMVMEMASNVSYTSTLRLNNIIIPVKFAQS